MFLFSKIGDGENKEKHIKMRETKKQIKIREKERVRVCV